MSLSFYVAGKFEDKGQVIKVMNTLTALGHKITYRWVDQTPTTNLTTLKIQAALDQQGVLNCNVFVALFLDPLPYLNVYVELGMALATDKIVCVVGASHEHYCIFTLLDMVHRFKTLANFYKFIATLG